MYCNKTWVDLSSNTTIKKGLHVLIFSYYYIINAEHVTN